MKRATSASYNFTTWTDRDTPIRIVHASWDKVPQKQNKEKKRKINNLKKSKLKREKNWPT